VQRDRQVVCSAAFVTSPRTAVTRADLWSGTEGGPARAIVRRRIADLRDVAFGSSDGNADRQRNRETGRARHLDRSRFGPRQSAIRSLEIPGHHSAFPLWTRGRERRSEDRESYGALESCWQKNWIEAGGCPSGPKRRVRAASGMVGGPKRVGRPADGVPNRAR